MKAKIDAVGVTSSNFKSTVKFYSLLGFDFPEYKKDEQHLEANTKDGGVRLMIDSTKMFIELNDEEPKPGNRSAFAVLYESIEEVNKVSSAVKEAGFKVIKEPWDAFWGQRYAVVEDPDGYRVDLFARL